MTATNNLVRLRADPSKVRSAVRSCNGGWMLTIRGIGCTENVVGWVMAMRPTLRIIDDALNEAQRQGLDGIDRYCEWTYPHPQRKVGGET